MEKEESQSKNFVPNHSLEHDGNLLNLFQYLNKKNKLLETCKVRIPDTIIYEHNFPAAWYFFKNNSIQKKTGKELESKHIENLFNTTVDKVHGIAAYFLSQTEDPNGNLMNKVEYFDLPSLMDFLYKRKTREKGVLQQFITPRGPYNFLIQAIWSPHVCRLERRVNVNKLTDKKQKPFERGVTYEGPSHYSNEVFCAPHLEKEIEKVCHTVVQHIEEVEHQKITRMVLFFKICKNGHLWLLWSSSIRVEASSKNGTALDLSPRFLKPHEMDSASATEGGDNNNNATNGLSKKDLEVTVSSPQNVEEKPAFESPKLRHEASSSSLLFDENGEPKIKEETALEIEMHEVEEELDNLFYQIYSVFLQGTPIFNFVIPQILQNKFGGENLKNFNALLKKYSIYSAAEELSDPDPTKYFAQLKTMSSLSQVQMGFKELKLQILQAMNQ